MTTLAGGDDKGSWHTLRPQEMQRITDFLVQNHSPSPRLQTAQPSVIENSYLQENNRPAVVRELDSPYDITPPSSLQAAAVREVCAYCGKPVTPAVARYCQDQERRFGGKIYCMEHQRVRSRQPSTLR